MFSKDKIDKESQIILAVVPHIISMALIFTDDYVGLNENNVSKFVLSRIICHNKKSQNLMCDLAVKHLFSWRTGKKSYPFQKTWVTITRLQIESDKTMTEVNKTFYDKIYFLFTLACNRPKFQERHKRHERNNKRRYDGFVVPFDFIKRQTKQECIPVGCIPTAAVAATRCQYWRGSASGGFCS